MRNNAGRHVRRIVLKPSMSDAADLQSMDESRIKNGAYLTAVRRSVEVVVSGMFNEL
jgi:hypothetical protein